MLTEAVGADTALILLASTATDGAPKDGCGSESTICLRSMTPSTFPELGCWRNLTNAPLRDRVSVGYLARAFMR
jgi:hypothetical protein